MLMLYFGNGKQFIYYDSSTLSKSSGIANYSKQIPKEITISSFVQIKWEFNLINFHLQFILEPMNELVIFTVATNTILNTDVQFTPQYN